MWPSAAAFCKYKDYLEKKENHAHAIVYSFACNSTIIGVVQLIWTSGILSCDTTALRSIIEDRFVKKLSGIIFWNVLCIYKSCGNLPNFKIEIGNLRFFLISI